VKLGMQVGRGPNDSVLNGDPGPAPQVGTVPQFWSMSIVSKWLDGSRRHLVKASTQASVSWMETQSPPQFFGHVPCVQTAGWIKMPLGMKVGLGSGSIVLHGDPDPLAKGAQPPIFGPCLLWPNGGPSQLLLSTCTYCREIWHDNAL